MARCSKCYKYVANRNKKYYAVKNNPTTLLCDECYHQGRAQQIKSNTTVGSENVEVRGATIHTNIQNPGDIIKDLLEKGPPQVDDKELHVIDHDDEDKGYLWIDGKKVKKDNTDELK